MSQQSVGSIHSLTVGPGDNVHHMPQPSQIIRYDVNVASDAVVDVADYDDDRFL